MLSGASWTTLHKVFTCVIMSQEYQDNIELDLFLCIFVWRVFDNIAQGFYRRNIVSRVLRQH